MLYSFNWYFLCFKYSNMIYENKKKIRKVGREGSEYCILGFRIFFIVDYDFWSNYWRKDLKVDN